MTISAYSATWTRSSIPKPTKTDFTVHPTATVRSLEQRKKRSLTLTGYKSYQYSLCLAEIDARRMMCRVLPAGDFDKNDKELGEDCIITEAMTAILPGINDEWRPIRSKKSHPMIRDLAKMFFPKDTGDR